jgi:hypothetical protein
MPLDTTGCFSNFKEIQKNSGIQFQYNYYSESDRINFTIFVTDTKRPLFIAIYINNLNKVI